MVRWWLQGARNNLDSVLIWPYLGICTARAVVKVARVFKICWCLSFLHRLSVARLIARLFHRRSWTLTDYVIIDCWLNFCFNWVQFQVLVCVCLIHRLEIERCDFRLRKGIKAILKANLSPRQSRDFMLVYSHVEACFTNTQISVIRDVVNVFNQMNCSFFFSVTCNQLMMHLEETCVTDSFLPGEGDVFKQTWPWETVWISCIVVDYLNLTQKCNSQIHVT